MRDYHVCVLADATTDTEAHAAALRNIAEYFGLVVQVTDGAPSNNQHDMFHTMYLAAVIHKVNCRNPSLVPAETVLEMATVNGARALGLEREIGSLEPGKRADLIILRADTPHLTPVINPVSNLVYAASGREVDTVMVNGRLLMQDRRVLTMDEGAVLRTATERAARLVARSHLNLGPRWPIF
jgi:cytosine/adenosine deaminase-related metal-dependent hydrolase